MNFIFVFLLRLMRLGEGDKEVTACDVTVIFKMLLNSSFVYCDT